MKLKIIKSYWVAIFPRKKFYFLNFFSYLVSFREKTGVFEVFKLKMDYLSFRTFGLKSFQRNRATQLNPTVIFL